jgi:sulfane dehydrogenase subunit SoxC
MVSSRATPMDPSTPFQRRVPLERLVTRVTPTDDVYVVAHMGVARVDVEKWRLAVDGLVEHPFELDYTALTRLPQSEVTAVLECFGNPLEPDAPTRKAGNVVWSGVRLVDLLERAKVRPGAHYLCAEGLDHGRFFDFESDRYVKDLPLAKALEPDVLVVLRMNGATLAAEHGFPARLFVPGYFGTNSVKWLSRLSLSEVRPENLFTTRLYNRKVVVDGQPVLQPARELDVQAVIVSPGDAAALPPGRHEISGWAWSSSLVLRVDVSTDGGVTWQRAELAKPSGHEWQAFELSWSVDVPGRYELRARAMDDKGRVQQTAGRNAIQALSVGIS